MHSIYNNLLLYALFLLVLLPASEANGQEHKENEYYITFPDKITSRAYLSRKYTSFRIRDKAETSSYTYHPNSTLNLGVGATYRWATLNLAYGFGFLNPDRGRGDTRYLDLQAHAYPRKFVVDLFGQFYKGYYLGPGGRQVNPDEAIYTRPDLNVTKLGGLVQYVFNHEKFSYRAAFLQNEWQKKSAGTFLLGFEAYGGGAKGDSALVPAALLEDESRNFHKARFLEFGPNAGYAYTLVIKKHVFLSGSASTNLGFGYTTLTTETGANTRWGISSNIFLRGTVGYNSERWAISANYLRNNVNMPSSQGFHNTTMTGNYRVILTYRFLPGPGLQRRLRRIGGE